MKREGILKEAMADLWKNKEFVTCRYCAKKLAPGLMSEAEHWSKCPKNPRLIKMLETKSPLIDHLKKIIKL
jgi:hypothetical protein